MGGSAKAPKPTAEQVALERRQRGLLQEETAESERRMKAIARGKLGKQSLLAAPATAEKEPPISAAMAQAGFDASGKDRKNKVFPLVRARVGRLL